MTQEKRAPGTQQLGFNRSLAGRGDRRRALDFTYKLAAALFLIARRRSK
jgi:hypothetical protein